MRAVTHPVFGEASDVLEISELPTPDPGRGEVRLRILLSPIHNHDLWTIRGTYGFKPDLPARAGTEAVGVVDAVGEGVEHLQVGQRVATGGTFGVWSEYVVTKAAGLIPVPDGIDDETAAQLVAMPFSALSLLDYLDVDEGDWIVQNTANGAVGRLLARFAAARGVRVLGLVRRDAGVEELAAVGIHDVVSTEDDGWRDRADEILGGAHPRAAVDSVGGTAAGDLLSLLGDGGTLVSFGAMGSDALTLSSGDLIFKQLTVKGFWGSRVSAEMDADKRRALFGELLQRVGSGEVQLPVEAVYPADEARAAAAASAVPGRAGKILLRF
ncbi:oxidoreductase/dehydrogenase [Cnuibacter physcomitrellae]|uniref:enoyl-[acyl-carrier-protein] reductase n=1 Tax=Cnuibacter physcomitrellae TaxID=1619308 RepID=A0A1X9LLB1_9MICO|nr:zinc-binding dehydrogenase [Cnuibacter physcomitrellae]ARJ03909.1 NADPH:quinone oxidoreductase [Cnuibacter physcomitrellae]GGI39788.1 oxidoreductase/dehydrogenase [Cnuibacter physcomitrellae]